MGKKNLSKILMVLVLGAFALGSCEARAKKIKTKKQKLSKYEKKQMKLAKKMKMDKSEKELKKLQDKKDKLKAEEAASTTKPKKQSIWSRWFGKKDKTSQSTLESHYSKLHKSKYLPKSVQPKYSEQEKALMVAE